LGGGLRGKLSLPRTEERLDIIFGSNHPGGANFCYGDGSVHFLQESIDVTVYQGMASRNGGEVLAP